MNARFNDLYQEMLLKYPGGLSNTSTKKFDPITEELSKILGVSVHDIYATGAASRPGNLEVRLSQGVRATTHTVVGLGFIVDDKNNLENVAKLTNSALVTCEKFLGRGKAHYDNIIIFVESGGILSATGIIFGTRTEITNKLIELFDLTTIKEVDASSNNSSELEKKAILEPSIANYITKHDDEDLSSEDLVKIFQHAYKESKKGEQGTIANLFGILYAPHIEDIPKNGENSIAEMALGKGGYGSMGDEIGRGISIGLELRKHIQKQRSLLWNVSSSTPTTYSHYLTALRTKPFMLLAGISGTGKSRIVRKLAQSCVTEELQRFYDPNSIKDGFDRWQLHKPANFELVQVKPNWHNSLEVVGYKSNIGGTHYEFTPFVRFVVRAWQHQDIPFFLCLDEMNLAPVEQYFAEFLSAIESRSIENGEYETDPIIKPFCEFNATDSKGNVTDNLADRMIAELLGRLDTQTKSELAERFRTKGLTLPKNLFVLGTVNMDETTFSFSRKVLDRAMSIVMNEVKYEQFFIGASENDMDEMSADTMQLLIDREIRGVQAEQNDSGKVESYLNAINGILDNTPFKLGYRAANEALLYVSATHLMSDKSTEEALDEFTLMKILSRIEGDKRSVDTILTDLQEVINETYPKSNKKLKEMAETLKNKQFVSYWN